MKRTFCTGFAVALLVCQATVFPRVAAAQGVVAAVGLTSTKDAGVVSVMSDPTLSNGRLILKVVAMNRAKTAAGFGPSNVKVFTAAGTPVPLLSLEYLVGEAKASAGSGGAMSVQAPNVHAGPIMGHDASGRPDVSGYTGGNSSMNGIPALQTRRTDPRSPAKDDPRVQQQVASLNAAILHDLTIAPAAVEGGQIVTDKLKFARKEEHALRVVVDFNGEQHEFNFAAPPVR